MRWRGRQSMNSKWLGENFPATFDAKSADLTGLKMRRITRGASFDHLVGTSEQATLFVKSGDDYVRGTTHVAGSVQGRALGTILDPRGKAIVNINKGEAFYGEVDILGKLYETGYDPIKDASGKVIGIWYVGYEK